VERPNEARLPDDVQCCLAELARASTVAIITGRAADDARRMLSFEPSFLIGNHGAEGLPGWQARSLGFEQCVRAWREAVTRCDLAQGGIVVEDKRYSLSLHYRMAADPDAARASINRCVAQLSPAPRVIDGKAVVNLLPATAPDKGDALRALIEQTGARTVLYVGDDDTDERVFGLHLPSVLTLRVEPAADSAATLFLRDQREVLTLVRHIARERRRDGARARERCREQ
jgi:trehalose 6-phosphate phosphatase